jgi:hopanoid biosynthesis associated RND transporter like protein HpnN
MKSLRTFLQKILGFVAQISCQHPWKVILTSTFFCAVGVWLAATKLGVVNDVNALIRQDSEVLRYFLDYQKEFQAADPILIVVQGPDFEKNRSAVDALSVELKDWNTQEIDSVYYKNDLSRLRPHFLLFQTPEELKAILAQLKNQRSLLQGKPGKTVNLNTLLDGAISQFDRVAETKGKKGSLDDLELYAERMIKDLDKLAKQLSAPVSTLVTPTQSNPVNEQEAMIDREILRNQYLQFEDSKLFLMMITPGKGDSESFSPHKETIKKLRLMIARVKAQHPEVKIGLTGEPVLMADELEQTDKDMTFAAILALSLIAISFFVVYKEIARPLLALIALVFAVSWSLGFAVLGVGHLNIISQAFVLMLMGLGIDFSIQITGRYQEERLKGFSIDEAFKNTLQTTGIAILTGGLTTAIAFFTMCFNDFVGLAELGLIASMGLIFCLLASLVLLPAMITVWDRRKVGERFDHLQMQTEFGRKVDGILVARPVLILVIVTLFTAFCAWQITRIKFDYNLLNMQSPNLESVQLARHLVESPALSFLFGVILADNLEDAKIKTAKLEAMPSVRDVMSPTKIIPENQEFKLPILAEIKKELSGTKLNIDVRSQVDVAKAKTNLALLLKYCQEGQQEASKFAQVNDSRVKQALKIFDRLVPALESSLQSLENLSQDEAAKRLNKYQFELFGTIQGDLDFLKKFDLDNPVNMEDLPPQALARYIAPTGRVLLEVNPKENIWERDASERFVKDLRSVDPSATGTPVQNYTYIAVLRDSYLGASLWALLAILIMVSIHFRDPLRIALSLIPLFVGVVWSLGLMALFNIAFNPANIIALPLVIGIGVAYGVYVIDRHDEDGKFGLFAGSTGKAILLSALTTIYGFASMLTGQHPGLVSLGLVMSMSVFLCFISSAVVLPQILVLLDERKTKSKLT